MIQALMKMGYSEEEVIKIVMENFACGEGEAMFIIDLELRKDVSDVVAIDEGEYQSPSESPGAATEIS